MTEYVRFESAVPNARGTFPGVFALANGLAAGNALSADDQSWHRAANERAHQLYDSYVKELHLYRRQNFNAPGNMRRSNLEHRRLYEAIAQGDAARAKQCAEEHIQAGRQRLLASADEK